MSNRSPWTQVTGRSPAYLAKSYEASCVPLVYTTIINNLPVASTIPMSSSTPCQTPSTPSSNFNSILDAALNEYKKKTGSGLLEHPFAAEVKRCDSIGAISAILQGQAREFQQFKDGDQRLMKWINPMVDALFTFSETLGGVASIVHPGYPIRFA